VREEGADRNDVGRGKRISRVLISGKGE